MKLNGANSLLVNSFHSMKNGFIYERLIILWRSFQVLFTLFVCMLPVACSMQSNEQEDGLSDFCAIRALTERAFNKGVSSGIYLNDSDLYQSVEISDFMNPRPKKYLDDLVRQYLVFELINENEFIENRKKSTDLLIADTLLHRKENGTITLSFYNGMKRFKDRPDAESEMVVYHYLGHYDFIGYYLMYEQYYEASCSYVLLDQFDHNVRIEMKGYPMISPDRKNLLSLSFNPYGEYLCEMELFKINGRKITSVMHVLFTNWAPCDINESYMDENGTLYIQFIHRRVYWKTDGKINTQCRYMKLNLRK